jgi:DNA invertase Pin-like site-specific DNA recombinase
MKCIIIARVSTFDQNVDPQIEILKSYAKSLGYKHFKLIYAKESGFLGVNYRKSVNELMVAPFFWISFFLKNKIWPNCLYKI